MLISFLLLSFSFVFKAFFFFTFIVFVKCEVRTTMEIPPPPTSAPLPTDLIDFVINQGNGVKGLSQTPIKSVPPKFIQPPQERIDFTKVIHQNPIPIIDVSNWEDPTVRNSICEAAKQWGFFQIINHGVPLEVMENVRDASHRFFDLPVEERRKYLKKNLPPASTVELKTSFSPQSEKVFEWKDYLSHVCSCGEDQEGSEHWPPVSKDQVLEYMKWANPLIKKFLEVLLMGLNLKKVDIASLESILMGKLIVNLIYYPDCPNPELTAGTGRHSDISTITVLLQDDVGGLYVRSGMEDDIDSSWIHVTPVKGALVINVGDVLQILSNDQYKSIEHRVFVNGSRNRVSVPIFVNPAPDAAVGPLSQVLERGEKPVYKQINYSDYFKYFFSKPHDGKLTVDFARI